MTIPFAAVEPLTDAQVGSVWDLLERHEASAAAPLLARCAAQPGEPLWILAHCTDGVTWGRVDGGGVALSCSKVPQWPTPQPRRANLVQVRLFGPRGEVLVWRQEDRPGAFRGRFLADSGQADDGDPLRPKDEVYLVAASRREGGPVGGFTLVADGTGRRQVVPLELPAAAFEHGQYPLGMGIRHYLAADEASGRVRVVASRFCSLRTLGERECMVTPYEEE